MNSGIYGRRDSAMNPKTDPSSNTQKDPEDWISGNEPMTDAQKSYLKTLCEQAHAPDSFREDLTKAEASQHIDDMKEKLGLD